MNEFLFALMIVSKVPGMPDQEVAVFNTRAQCMQESKNIIQQGPSAYCVPKQKVNVEAQMNMMVQMLGRMKRQMDEEFNKNN
jgi:hypothetical protein